MTRDIRDRLELFAGQRHTVERIALNMAQVEAFNPPPNPTKLSDSRARQYMARYGASSWELDALDPNTIVGLIRAVLDRIIDQDAWTETEQRIQTHRATLATIAANYRAIKSLIAEGGV